MYLVIVVSAGGGGRHSRHPQIVPTGTGAYILDINFGYKEINFRCIRP
jgi:hypothetical protein